MNKSRTAGVILQQFGRWLCIENYILQHAAFREICISELDAGEQCRCLRSVYMEKIVWLLSMKPIPVTATKKMRKPNSNIAIAVGIVNIL